VFAIHISASAGVGLRLANGVALLAKFDGEFASHSSTSAGTGMVLRVVIRHGESSV